MPERKDPGLLQDHTQLYLLYTPDSPAQLVSPPTALPHKSTIRKCQTNIWQQANLIEAIPQSVVPLSR